MNIDQFRALCAAQPATTVDVKWECNEVYSVGEKMFAVFGLNDGHICFKVDPARFLELTDMPGVRPAPYLARHHWVALDRPENLPESMLTELVAQSYWLVRNKLPAKLRNTLPR
ncbi:MmcQ/YjbR family DNA-binding protein [Andreprevotia chitinilytica]|uniref:MmcQ/YjbR family DNA-binding protein n=1 Tax=Andreprevotia chitinilytica TaxID=396808 RepID=UPI00055018D7|nr:MmcQ/YjbR family DNA-binding protein [Andreprevotia chitinilytica]